MFKRKNSSVAKSKQSRLISYLFTLSAIFFFIQLAAELSMSGNATFVAALIKTHAIKVPAAIFTPLILFAVIQIVLYIVFSLSVWAIARLIGALFKLSWGRVCEIGFAVWFCSAVAIIAANQVLYPASSFANMTSVFVSSFLAQCILGVTATIVGVAVVLALIGLLKVMWQKSRLLNFIVVISGATLFLLVDINKPLLASNNYKNENDLPNIIFIGVDSLRPDYTGINDPNSLNNRTPNLNKFLQSATIFTSSTTPIARTFPSWTSILTGEFPVHTNARFNLEDQQAINLTNSLSDLLKQKGYETYYATDEKRFSNISKRYGFDHLIGPTPGVDDFLLGSINDLPFSNLIINTRLGQLIFPYNAGNRASYQNYQPQTFNEMVEEQLLTEKHRPLFIAVHFCLPHWPYSWGAQAYEDKLFPAGLYALAVKRSDEQAEQFIQFLQQNHFLDHAIVVVLSDHGEGILQPHDRIIDRKTYVAGPNSDKNVFQALDTVFGFKGYHFDTSYGHGSDILSYVQFHTVLAVRTFGMAQQNVAARINEPVSLIDIKPTILSMVNLPSPSTDGISLKSFIYGDKAPDLSNRFVFSETGFNPIAMKASQIDIKGTVLQGIQVFSVNPSCSIEMNANMAAQIIPTKQRAVLYKNWILALYPQHPPQVVAVLVNRTTGQWTDDLGSAFAKQAPVQLMMQKLADLYGKEVTAYCPYLANCIKST